MLDSGDVRLMPSSCERTARLELWKDGSPGWRWLVGFTGVFFPFYLFFVIQILLFSLRITYF